MYNGASKVNSTAEQRGCSRSLAQLGMRVLPNHDHNLQHASSDIHGGREVQSEFASWVERCAPAGLHFLPQWQPGLLKQACPCQARWELARYRT
jgi:hypothetical protein